VNLTVRQRGSQNAVATSYIQRKSITSVVGFFCFVVLIHITECYIGVGEVGTELDVALCAGETI